MQSATKLAPVVNTCPKCGHEMLTGEVVRMYYSGEAIEHVNCSTPVTVDDIELASAQK